MPRESNTPAVGVPGAPQPIASGWRPNDFDRGDAVHGSTSVPASAASRGCVRVTMLAMNRVWSQLCLGERVYMYR